MKGFLTDALGITKPLTTTLSERDKIKARLNQLGIETTTWDKMTLEDGITYQCFSVPKSQVELANKILTVMENSLR